MEVDEGSSNGRRRQKPKQKPKRQWQWQRRASVGMSFEKSVDNLSRAGRETLVLVNRKRRKLLNTIPYTLSNIFDNTCPQYCWLRFGWIAEERRKLSGRLYRYYYDPMGQTYNTRHEVETICRAIENNRVLITLED